jgi:hypothetical protein
MTGREESGSPFSVPELDTTLQHAPVPSTPPPMAGRGGRSRVLLAVLATAALVGGSAVTAALVTGGDGDREASEAPPPPIPTGTGDSGVAEPPVPDVVGVSLAEARATLEAAGFEVEIEMVLAAAPGGGVVDQSPDGGERIPKGETVVLKVPTE